jgi:hypothetical protein
VISTALHVMHTTEVKGDLPLPGNHRAAGRHPRPWMMQSATATAAILDDLASGILNITLTALHPNPLNSPTEPQDSWVKPASDMFHKRRF